MSQHPYRVLPCLAFSALLLSLADVPKVYRFRQPPPSDAEIPAGEAVSVLPDLAPQAVPAPPAGQTSKPAKSDRLQDSSRLEIVRKISGEFCHAVVPIPGGKSGLRIRVGKAPQRGCTNSSPAGTGCQYLRMRGLPDETG